VGWIWIGVWVMIVGTIAALIPNAAPLRVAATARVEPLAAEAGD